MYWAVGPDRPAARQTQFFVLLFINFNCRWVGCCDNTPPYFIYGR